MITNKGKNIIAKYLIGDTPAYASFIALGCGPRPRPDIPEKTDVSTQDIAGTVLSTDAISSSITGLSSTNNLFVGMTLVKTSGIGSFKGTTTITAIPSLTSITISSKAIVTGVVASGTGSGARVTYTTEEDHNFLAGDTITIAGVIPTAFNLVGVQVAASPAPTAKTFAIANTATGSYVSGGVATTPNVVGAVTFNTKGSASVLSVPSTKGLWIGARVVLTAGDGQLASGQETIVSAIGDSLTSFTVSPAPIVNLLNATLRIETDPRKEVLDFEMFRVPVSSRGYVNDNGTNKIVLTAQMPTEQRYEISEVGIYSSGSNATAGRYDSKVITAFSADENWRLSVGDILESSGSESSLIFPTFQTSIINSANIITTSAPAIKLNTSNEIFNDSKRSSRYERPRFLDNVILLKSDSSQIFTDSFSDSSLLTIQPDPKFLQLNGAQIDLSRNSASDLMKVAFSLVSVTGQSNDIPDFVRLVLEFSNSSGSQVAQLQINVNSKKLNLVDNRYVVSQKTLNELIYSAGNQFSWIDVSSVRVYASATNRIPAATRASDPITETALITTGTPHNLSIGNWVSIFGVHPLLDGYQQVTAVNLPEIPNSFTFSSTANVTSGTAIPGTIEVTNKNYYIALDAVRVDNISTENPLYGLTGYSTIQNADELTIIKSPNTNNYIEYRFILDVT
jgi:hypothetical protein